MLQAIKHRLERCETWKQPHEDISWLVAEIERLQAERQTLALAFALFLAEQPGG